MEGVMIEVRHAPFWKSELPFDSLEKVGECQVRSEFKITDIPNSRYDGKMSHLSSRFKAALRLPDGTTVSVGEPFFIENWRDFIDNPYSFSISGSDYSVNDFGAKGTALQMIMRQSKELLIQHSLKEAEGLFLIVGQMRSLNDSI